MTLVVVAIAVALIAIAWACAWQTMNWLGDAEDLIERAANAHSLDGGEHDENLDLDCCRYKRRTPRRSTTK